MTDDSLLPFVDPASQAVLVGLGFTVFYGVLLGVFAYVRRRHRVLTHGLRGTGVLVEVCATRLFEQRSTVEGPTVRVVVATAAVPSGVLSDQELPAGEYHPGQVVPVVQDPVDPRRLYVDRSDLERSSRSSSALPSTRRRRPVRGSAEHLGVVTVGTAALPRAARRGRRPASRS